MTCYALVDCNNFYAACERLFDPSTAGRPVVVLSNNDGCVVARCPLAKRLGIPMGMPAFELRDRIRKHNIAVRSSNYELYGDLSRRVMQVLTRFSPRIEIYSIDEAFLAFDTRTLPDPLRTGKVLRDTLLRWIGLPVSVGFGPTKTLAKAANWKAKRSPDGICAIRGEADRQTLLSTMPVGEVWGIGGRRARRLVAGGSITTAEDFVERLDAEAVRRAFGVTGLRTWHELAGRPCLELEEAPPARQSIRTSRSFGLDQTELPGIEAAVASFAESCAAKLRQAGLATPLLQVFLATNPFRNDVPGHVPLGVQTFDPPTGDSLEITTAARRLARRLFCPGCAYKKAGVIVSDLLPDHAIQMSLFDPVPRRPQRHALMEGIDALNRRFGSGTVVAGATLASPSDSWKMRQRLRSPRRTTRWDEIMQIR